MSVGAVYYLQGAGGLMYCIFWGHCACWGKLPEGVGEARKVLVQMLWLLVELDSSLLWSYILKCLLLRDVGVWVSALRGRNQVLKAIGSLSASAH